MKIARKAKSRKRAGQYNYTYGPMGKDPEELSSIQKKGNQILPRDSWVRILNNDNSKSSRILTKGDKILPRDPWVNIFKNENCKLKMIQKKGKKFYQGTHWSGPLRMKITS